MIREVLQADTLMQKHKQLDDVNRDNSTNTIENK